MEPIQLLVFAARVFEDLGVPYAVVGSMASSYFGEPRSTNDVDIVADLRLPQVDAFIARFPDADFYVSDFAVREAIAAKSQFNIIHPDSGLKLDVMIPAADEHSGTEITRRVKGKLIEPVAEVFFGSPEDIIIKKLEYFREGNSDKHLRDIAGILRVSAGRLDLDYITEWSQKLGLTDIWNEIVVRVGG